MTPEHKIQSDILVALSAHGCTPFRINVGSGRTVDGRHFNTGAPKGHPDIYFFRWSDGKIGYVEVKTKTGRLRPDQIKFHKMLLRHHIIHCCARSVEDALTTAKQGLIGYGYPDYKTDV